VDSKQPTDKWEKRAVYWPQDAAGTWHILQEKNPWGGWVSMFFNNWEQIMKVIETPKNMQNYLEHYKNTSVSLCPVAKWEL
jgi:hypothetical protein